MTAGVVAVVVPVSILVGVLAHEATHYVVAALFGREPRFYADVMSVEWISPVDGRGDLRDAVIGSAPVLVGVVVLPVVYMLACSALPFVGGLGVALSWGVYTVYIPGTPGFGASQDDYVYLRELAYYIA